MKQKIGNLMVKVFGPLPTLFFGDSGVLDRWLWMRKRIIKGHIRTLDAGCGSGAFSFYLAKKSNEVLGISFDEKANSRARKREKLLGYDNVEFITENLNNLGQLQNKIGRFDQIICFETLEHMIDDEMVIKNFSNIIKPGGKLLITVPYKYYRRLPEETISEEEDGGHVRLGYTHKELENILQRYNFDVLDRSYITGVISYTNIKLSRVLRRKSFIFSWIISLILRPFQLLDPLVMRFINYPYSTIGMVAIKKREQD